MFSNYYKISVTLLCLLGFAYQSFILLSEYLSGKTVTNIHFRQLYNEGLPGVTICPGALSLSTLANFSDEFKVLNLHYINLNRSSPDFDNESKLIYQSSIRKMDKIITDGKIDIGSIFYNYTFTFKNENDIYNQSIMINDISHSKEEFSTDTNGAYSFI